MRQMEQGWGMGVVVVVVPSLKMSIGWLANVLLRGVK